ncbi:hypothetical protein J7E71_22565 [Mesobacillus foraminis]|uniref:hypothetical protein n=1 Tax=Mesobacillus foraminis TaxID=279826 RepID=UPI001BECF0B4|nr:hypothetical protein [Mesobacillus foraminis]MBT2758659.1 hypothetical protein [Mesobacillus foraminis]
MKNVRKRGGFLEHSRIKWINRANCSYPQADWGFSGVHGGKQFYGRIPDVPGYPVGSIYHVEMN